MTTTTDDMTTGERRITTPGAIRRLRDDWPLASLSALSIGLLAVLGAVLFHGPTFEFVRRLFDLSEKADVLTFLGFGVGGLLVALQAAVSYKRAKAMEDAARAQAAGAQAQARAAVAQAEANTYVERGQRQQRLKDAIEHLGHQSVSIRLGGVHELVALAHDTEGLRRRVSRILCAHVCVLTTTTDYQTTHASKPSVEVQSLLSLLFETEEREPCLFQGQILDLTGSWLNGAQLDGACAPNAALDGVSLQEAVLDWAHLPFASLDRADLRGASLAAAVLPIACLTRAQLQGANLFNSHLQAADLSNAGLQGAYLKRVRLFFVGDREGSMGFCEQHGKTYLIRRRRGEGGGGGSATGGTIPSA